MKRFNGDLNIQIECSAEQLPRLMAALGESLQCDLPHVSTDTIDGRCRVELQILSELTIQPCS